MSLQPDTPADESHWLQETGLSVLSGEFDHRRFTGPI
jgi:hypothetical protein